MRSQWSQCLGAFRLTVSSTRNGGKCGNIIGLCLTMLTENFGMQLVSSKFAHDFWWLNKRRTDWRFAQTFCNNLKSVRTWCSELLWVMRHGYAGMMMLKQSSNLHNSSKNHPQGWKKCKRAGQVWRQCSLFSLTSEVWCIIIVFLEVKKWIRNFLWPFYSICEKQCETYDWNFGRSTAGFVTVTILPCTWWWLSRSAHTRQNASGSTAILLSCSPSSRLFPVPRLES